MTLTLNVHPLAMDMLHALIEQHTEVLDTQDETAADVVFFRVKVRGQPDREQLRELLQARASQGTYGPVDVFDGKEHGYIELGGWLDSQGLALRLMGLGQQLGLWQLLTPRNMLGPGAPEDLVQQMAGAGYVTVAPMPART